MKKKYLKKLTRLLKKIKIYQYLSTNYIKKNSETKTEFKDPFYKFPDPMTSTISHPLSPGYNPLNSQNNNILSNDPNLKIIRDNGFDYYKNRFHWL